MTEVPVQRALPSIRPVSGMASGTTWRDSPARPAPGPLQVVPAPGLTPSGCARGALYGHPTVSGLSRSPPGQARAAGASGSSRDPWVSAPVRPGTRLAPPDRCR